MNIDIRNLDLNLLKALDALLDERSVTRAAQRLSLTQPAVSAMLTRLRDCFDDPLFTRTQRGIVPTLRAQELAAPVKQLLHDARSLLQPHRFDPATASLTLTLAATDYALRAVIVPLIRQLRQQAPGIRVAIVPPDPQRMHEQLESAEVDMLLMTPHLTMPLLHSRHLFRERYVCVMRADHPDAGKPLSLARFCALDHVLVSYQGNPFSGVTDEALAQRGYQRKVTLSVSSFLVLADMLYDSDMIAVVPERMAMTETQLAIVEPPVAIPGFTKTLFWHERTHRSAAHRWVREVLYSLFDAPSARDGADGREDGENTR